MFKATRPFKDTVTGYDKEPSLRIGKKVPQNAVNLAYYYNPTATESEKILTADPPKQTIDHRIETQWLTKVNQASGPNGEEPSIDLFPKSIYYSDEEGYYGRLARQDNTVKWYPEKHVNQKEVSYDNIQIIVKKGDEDKNIEYADADGYVGNLYLDTVHYEVYKTIDASTKEDLDFTINNFELNYHEIFGKYLSSADINSGSFMNEPNPISGEDSFWPARIEITATGLKASDGMGSHGNTNNTVANFINRLPNSWEGANEQFINNPNIISTSKPVGYIYFDKLEYEPVAYNEQPKDGTISRERKIENIVTDNFNWDVTVNGQQTSYTNHLPGLSKIKINGNSIKTSYLADMRKDYSEIEEFIECLQGLNSYSTTIAILRSAIEEGKDIAVWLSDVKFVVDNKSIDMLVDGSVFDGSAENEINAVEDPSSCHFNITYKYVISDKGTDGTILYNITANYHSITLENGRESVTRTITTRKEEASSYRAYCHYSGLVNKNWIDYDGIAFYMGSVTKGNSVGNQNVDDDNEILMFPDSDGFLRQIVEGINESTDENNRQVYEVEYRSYYNVEADSIYLTNVFKDNVPCFYKYKLKQPIYDYRGPDANGFYHGDAVQIFTSMLKDIPKDYKHNMKLSVAQYEERTTYDQYNNPTIENIPKCYFAELYTSFISSSTDTFKVVYNGFNDIDDDNKVIDNGIEEDIYNFPYMIKDVDYRMVSVDRRARLNKIQLIDYQPLKDDRRRITFTWQIIASNPKTGKEFYSEVRQSSILNKDYCIPFEYSNFEGRGMIISPKLNGDSIPCSPRDLCLNDQAGRQTEDENYEPVISDTDTDFVYKVNIVKITKPGSVNIKCNPDGSGYITAETTLDTGFYDEDRAAYVKKLNIENPYYTDGEYIYQGYKVKCIDSRNIKVKAPRNTELLDSWYPLIQFGHYSRIMDQYGSHTKVAYSMPEYDTQHYSDTYGQPYMDVSEEKATIINSHMIKTKCYPLHILFNDNDNLVTIHVFKKIDEELFELAIKNVSFTDGIIIIQEAISENDNIIVNYTYLEENYNYRGYWRSIDDFIRIDLNPNMYHTYNNPVYLPSEVSPSKNLFNKVIYFFLRPSATYVVNEENGSFTNTEISLIGEEGELKTEREDCLYHKINDYEPEADEDILIGSVYIKQNTSLHSTILTDSRTRGGGVLEAMSDSLRHELEPESDFYLDIGYYDGKPYQENGVIVVRLDNRLLKEYGGRFTVGDVETKVKRWLGLGIYPIIEFVDSYKKEDLPQYTLEIEDSYTNVIDITPEIFLECIAI